MNSKITPVENILISSSDFSSYRSRSERFSIKEQRMPTVFAAITANKLGSVEEPDGKNKLYFKCNNLFSFTKYPIVLKNIDFEEKNLGDNYYFGINGIMQNLSEAIKVYSLQASHGNHYAQFRLGYCYNHGEGVVKNISQCIRLYLAAAENGNALAQVHLGDLYLKGIEVPRDTSTAISYYNRSDCPYAYHCLALCYFNGTGVPKNKQKALMLWHDAAFKGLAEAQYNMGVAYETGEIVTRKYKTAVYWYNRSSNQGHVPSIERLAYCYTFGLGVRMNKAKAIELYKIINVNVSVEVKKKLYDITSSIDAHNEDK